MSRSYLDHNATTPLDGRVLEAMLPFLQGGFGNASSRHEDGALARRAVEQSRSRVAQRLEVEPSEVVFTSGGTESNNLVIFASLLRGGAPHIIISAVEHWSVLGFCRALHDSGVVDLTIVPVDRDGRVNAQALAGAVRSTTALISVMAANNETGSLQPVREVGEIARGHGIPFHCDATQLAGKAPLQPAGWLADYVTGSAHKFYGPKGVGFLYRRSGAPWSPALFGGQQEFGVRPGTENVAGIVGLAHALDHASDPSEWDHCREMRRLLWSGIQSVPDVLLNTPLDCSVGNTLNVSFAGVSSDALMLALDLRGISVSSGAACHTATRAPSHVLLAMGRTAAEARAAIRFSVGRGTMREEIANVLEQLSDCVGRLRASAPRLSRPATEELAS